ncbi:serine/threonine-protein phosphatase [Streptacidiphilus sp. PB12-B1b]|uniref:PP2C family protein-serine/threonine phosphatase n=1 Tax=Streptacidiphilus sp. PB12-B1b TaxID=2705012 RepID=UPI0015FBC31E|nr:PP2C family protein-serine/threonine phosphatase [Streptacidiphilus sp. PB12-B1b]QMU77108.1 serine/threonine-protein phosphatase [Streptacidiphilus sp. PB12-B1b]
MLRSHEDPTDDAAGEPQSAQDDEIRRLRKLNAELLAELEETNRGVVALYREEHQLALTLQRTFLPEHLPRLPGIELAVRYLPAATQTEIGGDFYEAIDTPGGLLLAVGDVMGHSLQAAVVMGELRHALRAFATEDHPPHVLLERLDTLLSRHRPGWTATVCVALLEPGTGRLRIANAGHPLPLLRTGPGRAEFVTEHGPLLGLGLPQPVGTSHRLAPGASLLMVTDGLIEKRGTPLPEALESLRRAAADGPWDCEALCDALLEGFGAQQRDDIVVFAARRAETG